MTDFEKKLKKQIIETANTLVQLMRQHNGDDNAFCEEIAYQISNLDYIDDIDDEFEPFVGTSPGVVVETTPDYWDCECQGQRYIHAKKDRLICPICKACEEDMPDSHQNEVDEGTHFLLLPPDDEYGVLETYPQNVFPKELAENDEWLDTHLTAFAILKKDLKHLCIDLNWDYEWFWETWTWDMTEQIYHRLKSKIIGECFIEREFV